VYISNTQANEVLKETLTNGVYSESVVVSTGLATPYGIAVDGSGNVYIADNGHNRVVEETPSGSSYSQTVVSTTTPLSYPTGLAADASGDLYIADTGGGKILVERPSGGGYIETSLTYSSNFAQLTGIAVDSSGNIYVSDIDNQAVYMETYSAGSYTPSTVPTSGLNYPYDIAVDASGNLYISDFSNKRIVLETPGSGTYTQSIFPTAGLGGALGVAIGAGGDVYIADTFGFDIKEVQYSPGNFGSVNVNSSAWPPVSMLFQFYGGSGGTLSLTGTQVLTVGATGLDFTDAGSGGCSTSSPYSAGDFCWVDVDFTPLYPGTRMGAVQLLGTSAAVLANGYVDGMGMGPQMNYQYLPAFFESYVHAIAGPPEYNLSEPFGTAVDSSGNVYVADYGNNAVYKMTLSAGTYTQSTIATGLNNPEGVAVDGAGNVYICDSGNNQILLETNAGGSWVQSAIATSLNFPTGVAVDALGDVYYSSFGDGAVYELTLSGGVYSSPATVATGLNQPRKIAVDASGNVYIADTGNSRVVKETLSGGSYTQSVIGSGMQYPYAVAVAADSTVFVSDIGHEQILAETWSNGSYTQSEFIPGPLAYDLQVDQMGNMIFPDVDAIVFLISYPQLPNMSFASANVGSTSSDSPQTVTITNVGNQPLTATAPALVVTGPNFVQVAGSGTPEDCGTGFSAAPLAPGASCNLAISFTPQVAGALTSTAVLTDNALNGNPATQTIPMQGTGVQQSQTITFGTLPNKTLGSAPFLLSATASSSLPVSFASLTTSVCTVSGSTSTLVALGTCTIQATQAGNAAYTAATPVSQSFQVTQQSPTSQTITFGSLSSQALGSAPFTLSATASSGLPVSFASLTTAVCTVSGSTSTLVAAGTCTIQATQAGNGTYAAATPVNQSFQVTQESQTITFDVLSNQTLGAVPFTVSATASSGLAVGFVSTTTAVCTVSGSMVTLHTGGTCTIQATQAGNTAYAAATPVSQSFQVMQQSPTSQTITFGSLSNMALGSAPITLSATASSGLPVSFASLTTSVCTVSGSTSTLVVLGTCTIQATQAGNGTYAAATSVSQSFQIEAATFTMTPSTTSATVTPGQSAVLTVKVTTQGSYTSPITFSCSGLPAVAACSFSPATVTPDANPATTTLTITTASQSALLTPSPRGGRLGPLSATWLMLPGMLLGMVAIGAPKRRKLLSCCLLFLVAGGCVFQSACGISTSQSLTPAGSYSIRVTGTAGATQQTVAVTLNVS
jgi:streptogramin lyase